jgi:cytochrome aa3-600 menaquinol oxidase subunit 4
MAQRVDHPSLPGEEAPQEFEPGLPFLRPAFAAERFPWPQLLTYGAAILLTLLAFALTRRAPVPAGALFPLLLSLAAAQAVLQLGVFMHVRESRGTAWQLLPLALALGVAVAMVVLSVWIMAFKWGVS